MNDATAADLEAMKEIPRRLSAIDRELSALTETARRLHHSRYPGAAELVRYCEDIDTHTAAVSAVVEDCLASGGDEAAFNYRHLILRDRMSLAEAEAALRDWDGNGAGAVEALKVYAAGQPEVEWIHRPVTPLSQLQDIQSKIGALRMGGSPSREERAEVTRALVAAVTLVQRRVEEDPAAVTSLDNLLFRSAFEALETILPALTGFGDG